MLKSLEIILEKWSFAKFYKIQNVSNCVPPRLTSIFWDLTFSKFLKSALNSPCKNLKVRTTPFDQYFLGFWLFDETF